MKKLRMITAATTACMCIFTVCYVFNESEYEMGIINIPSTIIRFEKDTLQLGTVKYGDKREATFRFVNTGAAPLIIKDVRPSCGCTGVVWGKHPIKPGKYGEIKITFSPNSLGLFLKNIEVYCNIKEGLTNLKLCGTVIE